MVNCNGVKLIWHMIKKTQLISTISCQFLHFLWILQFDILEELSISLKILNVFSGSFRTTWNISEVNIPREKYSLLFIFVFSLKNTLLVDFFRRFWDGLNSKTQMGYIYMVVKNGGRVGCLINCCWVLPRQCWKQLALWKLQVSDDTIRPFPPFMCIIIALSRENPKGYYGWTIWTPFAGWTLRRLLYKEWLDIPERVALITVYP